MKFSTQKQSILQLCRSIAQSALSVIEWLREEHVAWKYRRYRERDFELFRS